MVSNETEFTRNKIVQVLRNKEYRIEVNESQKYKIKVLKGSADIKGTELVNNRWYVFSDCKCSIFTFTGCELEVEGECELAYIGERSCYPKIFDTYNTIITNKKMIKPNILVIGDSVSTTCTTLCNYFIRDQKQVLFTEIDPSKGCVFPGALSTMKIETVGFITPPINNPFCLFYGSKEVENTELYELQLAVLSKKCNEMQREDVSISGNVIPAPFVDFDMLDKIIDEMNINAIVVVKNERLYHKTLNHLDNRISDFINIDFIQNNGYITENKITKSIKRYFHGEELGELNDNFVIKRPFTPSRIVLNNKNNAFAIIKVGEEFVAPDTALPLGANRKVGVVGVEEVDLVENAVLAISDATDREEAALKPVLGFLVCLDEKKGRILSCQPKLPKMSFLIQGSIKYIEY